MTPKAWEEGEEELRKSLPKTAEKPRTSLSTALSHLGCEYPPVDKPIPSYKKFQSVIVKQAGLNKPQPGATEQPCTCLTHNQVQGSHQEHMGRQE